MKPREIVPNGAVAGLSEILLALGDELRQANHTVGEYPFYGTHVEGETNVPEPILFLAGAEVQLSVAVTAEASGGVKVWVVNTEASGSVERSGTVKVMLNTGGVSPAVGM